MRPNRTLEIGTGLFILLGFSALFYLTTQLPASGLKLGRSPHYLVNAAFDNVGDLKKGSPVSMAGVTVGHVMTIKYDPKLFKAVVTMAIDPQYNQIPDDSDASIQTAGLLGGKYVGIGPGGSETFLRNGSQFTFTQSAIVLESLVNKFFASFASKDHDAKSGSDAEPTTNGVKSK